MSSTPKDILLTTQEIPYDKPLAGRKFLRIDLLSGLCSSLGENCFANRDVILKMITEVNGTSESRRVLQSLYRRFQAVRKLVNDVYYYHDIPDGDIYAKLSEMFLATIFYRQESVINEMNICGYKHLLTVNGYMYYAINGTCNHVEKEGMTIIC